MSSARLIQKKNKRRDGWAYGIHTKERNDAALGVEILYSLHAVCRDRSVYIYIIYRIDPM